MTATLTRRCSNCQRDNGTHAAWCDRGNDMADSDIRFHLAKVLDLFGKGEPRIVMRRPGNNHTTGYVLDPEGQAIVNAAREALKKHG